MWHVPWAGSTHCLNPWDMLVEYGCGLECDEWTSDMAGGGQRHWRVCEYSGCVFVEFIPSHIYYYYSL